MNEDYLDLTLKHSNINDGYLLTLEVLPDHYSEKKKQKIREKFESLGGIVIFRLIKQRYPEKLI